MLRRLQMFAFATRLIMGTLPLPAFALAWFLRFSGAIHFQLADYYPIAYIRLLVLTTIVWTLLAEHFRLLNYERGSLETPRMSRTAFACGITYVIVLSALFFYREQSFSRIFLGTSAIALLGFATATQVLLRHLMTTCPLVRRKTGLLIVGADAFAERTARELSAVQPSCEVIGFIRLPGQSAVTCHAPVSEWADLTELSSSPGLTDIVIAAPSLYWAQIPGLMPRLERFGVPIRATLDLGSTAVGDRVLRLGSMNLLSFGTTPFDSMEYVVLKRILDVVLSAFGLVLLAPVMLLIASLIRLTSRGPVFFVQERVGLNGGVFQMYKFRTMRPAPAAHSDTAWSEPARSCTAVGSFLRRWSFDELPQLFNVLRGDMSLVGPRPERPYFVRQFLNELSRYNVRHHLKVGMTGWAQVHGLRGDTSIEQRLQYDLFYLQNWSLAFDLRILLQTVASEWLGFGGRVTPSVTVAASTASAAKPPQPAALRANETTPAELCDANRLRSL